MVKIKITTRKRELTKINGLVSPNAPKMPHYAVLLYCNDRGKVYYLNTGFDTTNKDMCECLFNDPDTTRSYNTLRTRKLFDMVDECKQYADNHADSSANMIKDGLTAIVMGVEVGEVHLKKDKKVLADYIEEFGNTKEKFGTRKVYLTTAKKIRDYAPKVQFDDITVDWLDKWVKQMKNEGLEINTISIQLRNLRAVINENIKKDITNNNVFRKYSIKNERKRHLTLTAQDIADFRDYPCEDWQVVYRDLAMLSFYLCGVNIGDLLLNEGLDRHGRFVYERRKTGALGDVKVIPEAMEIINKYKGKKYLLNIMEQRTDYSSFTKQINKALKKIGLVEVGLDKLGKKRKLTYHPLFDELTTYTFRRSFASIASELDIPKEIIGQCLTHSWTDVTELYITRNPKKVDDCVRKVVDYLNTFKGRSKEEIDQEIRERDGLI